jgi:hypothetical protein
VAAVVLVMVSGLTVFMSGQQGVVGNSLQVPILRNGPQGPPEVQGLVDDWSHHHLIFSNPGTEEEAIKNGRYEEWLRVVNDPRYIMQQLKRRSPAQGPAAEYVARMNELARAREAAEGADVAEVHLQNSARLVEDLSSVGSRKAKIKRDWAMDMGAVQAAATGTFSGTPTGTSTVTLKNGSPTLTLTAVPSTYATGSIAIGSSFCFAPNAGVTINSTTFTTNATAGTGTYSVATNPAATETVVIGGVTYTFETTLSGTSPANQVLIGSGGTTTTNKQFTARNLSVAINNTGTCGNSVSTCTRNVSAANTEVSSTNTSGTTSETLTSLCADNAAITGTSDGSKVTVSTVAAGGPGSNTSTTFALGTNTATATNIYGDILGTSALTSLFNLSNPSGAVDLTSVTLGTGGDFTIALTAPSTTTGVTVSETNGTGTVGTDDFGTDGVNTDDARSLAAAINSDGGTVGVTATATGADVFVTAKTPGSGGDSITLSTNMTGSIFTWNPTTLANGGTTSSGTVGAGMYPAKFSFSTSTANCDNTSPPDFVVYNTGIAGSASAPSIVAYDNLYSGCPNTSVPVPNLYWQYNTGGTVSTSPVLFWDGSQVAFIQSNGTTASLVLLKWSQNPILQTLTAVPNGSYQTCTAPCMTSITFSGSANNTLSSPFYDYEADAIYVGDAAGKLHKFTSVFGGTPSEAGSPWPVTVSTLPLTSAVYDLASGLVFVCDNYGNSGSGASYLYSVSSSGTVVKSAQLTYHQITDGPLVDSTTEKVYVFVGRDMSTLLNPNSPCGSNNACSGVYQFPYNFTAGASATAESEAGIATTSPVYVGTFDNLYYTSEGTSNTTPTGSLYWCGSNTTIGNAVLARSAITSGALTAGLDTVASSLTGTSTAGCSPVVEILNGSTDYIFLSVTANGSAAIASGGNACTGACVYSFNVTTALGSGADAVDGLTAAGGTSGIIIDNTQGNGGSQIYFTPLSSQACAGNSAGTGAGTGACAEQASQSALQ